MPVGDDDKKQPRETAPIAAKSKDPKSNKSKGKEDPDMAIKKDELSEDDQRIKNEVELLVTRSTDADFGLATNAVNMLGEMLRTATGTVASIPKPLKFVRPHFVPLRAYAATLPPTAPHRAALYDILAMIAMTLELPEKHVVIMLKLQGSSTNIAQWGHEFLRHLCGDIGSLWAERKAANEPVEDLANLVHQSVSFFMTHADEAAAIDLAMEIGESERIIQYTDAANFSNVVQYLSSIMAYLPAPDDEAILDVAFNVCIKHGAFPAALRLALRSRDATTRVASVFERCDDAVVRKQLGLICARARHFLALTGDDVLDEIVGNNKLCDLFRHSARDLDSMAIKTPEDVFKEKLADASAPTTSHVQNLATLIANGFANCGFGTEALLKDDETWIYKTKDHRMMSATASLGLVHLWDADAGLSAVDKYAYSEDNYVKAGALLATGIVLSGIRSAFDPAFGLLSEHVNGVNREMRIGAILGLAFAYAGTNNLDVQSLLSPLVADSSQPFEVQCFAAYATALVHVGTCNSDASEAAMLCLMEKTPQQLTEPCARYLVLALGLLFLGAQDRADTLLEAVAALDASINRYAKVVILSCAYAGSGNVVMVQELFKVISSKDDDEADSSKGGDAPVNAPPAAPAAAAAAAAAAPGADGAAAATAAAVAPLNFKAAAVMGVGAIAMGEDLGANMVKRSILHSLLSKEDAKVSARRGVPLALALLSISDPQMPVVENLVKLSHDSDVGTAQAATFSIGLVGAGSNNARVAASLRALNTYYARDKEHNHGFVVKLAQSLLAMGKGHMTLSPLFHDATTVSPVALAGVLTLCYSALDLKSTLLDKYHYMIYAAAVAANPRMLLTVDAELNPLQTQVRVGQPVDTVTLPGKPKTITGFQQHNTPVLLSTGERAELVPGKYRSLSAGLEGICIVTEKQATHEDDVA